MPSVGGMNDDMDFGDDDHNMDFADDDMDFADEAASFLKVGEEKEIQLHYEKTHPSGLLHYTHGKIVTQLTW